MPRKATTKREMLGVIAEGYAPELDVRACNMGDEGRRFDSVDLSELADVCLEFGMISACKPSVPLDKNAANGIMG